MSGRNAEIFNIGSPLKIVCVSKDNVSSTISLLVKILIGEGRLLKTTGGRIGGASFPVSVTIGFITVGAVVVLVGSGMFAVVGAETTAGNVTRTIGAVAPLTVGV